MSAEGEEPMTTNSKKLLYYSIPALIVGPGVALVMWPRQTPVTAEACIGGLASYSKEVTESTSGAEGLANLDAKEFNAKLATGAKTVASSTVVTSTDPVVQKLSQFCWQPCQAWATSSDIEREKLFTDFRDCMKQVRAALPQPPAAGPVHQEAGEGSVLVGRDNYGDISTGTTSKPASSAQDARPKR